MNDRKNTDTIRLFEYGDVELWYAQAVDKAWSFPLFVRWKHEPISDRHFALVTPALCPYMAQARLLSELLDAHDIQGRKDQWIVPRQAVEGALHKAPGITPTAYYKWPDESYVAIPTWSPVNVSISEPGQTAVPDRSFVNYLCSTWNIPKNIVDVVIKAINEAAPKWMLDQRKALDLGFCRLIAVPFRPNWKEIVTFKLRKWKLRSLFDISKSERDEQLEDAGVPAALCSPHNIALHRATGQVQYSIEAIAGKSFDKACDRIESRRMTHGNTGYVGCYEQTVSSLYKHILDALEGYLEKTSHPFAAVHHSSEAGLISFVQAKAHSCKVRGVDIGQLPVHIIPPDSPFSVLGEVSEATLVPTAHGPVPEMPALPPANNDVRECEIVGTVDKPVNTGAGDTGMPLLDAGEGEAARQPVLPVTEVDREASSGMV